MDTLSTTVNEKSLQDRIDEMLCRATPDILADRQKRASNAEYLDRVKELIDFATARTVVLYDQNPYIH